MVEGHVDLRAEGIGGGEEGRRNHCCSLHLSGCEKIQGFDANGMDPPTVREKALFESA